MDHDNANNAKASNDNDEDNEDETIIHETIAVQDVNMQYTVFIEWYKVRVPGLPAFHCGAVVRIKYLRFSPETLCSRKNLWFACSFKQEITDDHAFEKEKLYAQSYKFNGNCWRPLIQNKGIQ